MTRRLLVITSIVYPPIPIRTADWQATLDGYEPGDPIGYGPTEADAVCALYCEIDEREDDDQERAEYETGSWQPRDPDLALEQKRDDEMLDKLHRQDVVPDDTVPF